MRAFQRTEWARRPAEVERDGAGHYLVSRNIEAVECEDGTAYVGELAIMDEAGYAAYLGAKEVAAKREQEITDEVILALIEEGSL